MKEILTALRHPKIVEIASGPIHLVRYEYHYKSFGLERCCFIHKDGLGDIFYKFWHERDGPDSSFYIEDEQGKSIGKYGRVVGPQVLGSQWPGYPKSQLDSMVLDLELLLNNKKQIQDVLLAPKS